MYKWLAWLDANRKPVMIGAIAVAVLTSAVGIHSWKQAENEREANARLFALPLAGAPEKLGHPTVEALQSIANEYPSTSAGIQAELLAAQTFFLNNDYPKAQTAFMRFLAAHEGTPMAAQAAVGLAASMEAQGNLEEALAKYKDAITRYSASGIAEPVKLTIARLLEEKKQPEMALKYYEELSGSANRYDPWVSEAQEREAALLAHNPQLKRPVKAAPAANPLTAAAPKAAAPTAAPANKPAPAGVPAAKPVK